MDVSLALSCLRDVPGCNLAPKGFDIPHTAWMLPAFDELVLACGVRPPRLERSDFSRSWKPLKPLYPYQQEGVEFALQEPGVLIADEMGLGKTYQAAVAAERVRQAYGGVGIIVGPLMVRDTWMRELKSIGAIDQTTQFCSLVSKNLDDPSFRTEGVRYYFLHYDVADAWWSQLMVVKRVVAIIDEAHWIRNSRAKRSRAAQVATGSCRKRILLTGTPLDNKPADLWFPLTVATGTRTWGSPLDFRKRYAGAQYNGFGWEDTVATHVDELRMRLEPFFLRRTADEVGLQLPPLTRVAHRMQLSVKAQAQHDAILEGVSAEALVDALVHGVVDDALPALTRLRKLTSRAKLQTTADFVANALDQGQSLIVSCWERAIAERLCQHIVAPVNRKFLITGDQPQARRNEAMQRFQDTPRDEASVLVSTLGSLREGVTLHRARIVVVHDLHWVLNHLLQLEKRIHRIGQVRPCQAVWMLANQSIDTIMAPILLEKAKYAKDILDIDAGLDATSDLGLQDFSTSRAVDDHIERALEVWRNT